MSHRNPDWTCPKCNDIVFGSRADCRKCHYPNPALAKQQATTVTAAPATRGTLPDWVCPKCNFVIWGSKPSCKKCGSENPGLKTNVALQRTSPPPPQQQQQATGSSSATATATTTTTTTANNNIRRPFLPDWTCPVCADLVFGSRPGCRRCGAPNPGFKTEASSSSSSSAKDPAGAAEELTKLQLEVQEAERKLQELNRQSAGQSAPDVTPPSSWEINEAFPSRGVHLFDLLKEDPSVGVALQKMIKATSGVTIRLHSLQRVQNDYLWIKYCTTRNLMPPAKKRMQTLLMQDASYTEWVKPLAILDVFNEAYLFHGTKKEIVGTISEQGLDERVGSLSGVYGSGVYFAENFSKSNSYTTGTVRYMFLTRVSLGRCLEDKTHRSNARRAPDGYDCVVGSTNHREFVVYDRGQTYPEYIFTYSTR